MCSKSSSVTFRHSVYHLLCGTRISALVSRRYGAVYCSKPVPFAPPILRTCKLESESASVRAISALNRAVPIVTLGSILKTESADPRPTPG